MNGPTEPSADMRSIAFHLRQYHVALVQEGFTDAQALTIIGYTLASAIGNA